jgi:hypothetical protein
MPQHFTIAGARKYGYQPRSGEIGPGGVPMEPPRIPKHGVHKGRPYTRMIANPKYAWRKRRQMGHGRPLVWSGASETAARAAVQISSRRRGNELQGLAAMPLLPKYFYQYLKAGTYQRRGYDSSVAVNVSHEQPHKFEELTRLAGDELDFLTDLTVRHIQRRMGEYRSRDVTPAA